MTDQPPADHEGLWVRSWRVGTGYGARVNLGERTWTLGRDRAVAYAAAFVRAAMEAEHDAAVVALLGDRVGMPQELVASFVNDLRLERRSEDGATEPLHLVPGVSLRDDDRPHPFIAMHLDGEQVGQLTPAAAREHGLNTLAVLAAADLDDALRRFLVDRVHLDEARASAVIANLPEYWPSEDDRA